MALQDDTTCCAMIRRDIYPVQIAFSFKFRLKVARTGGASLAVFGTEKATSPLVLRFSSLNTMMEHVLAVSMLECLQRMVWSAEYNFAWLLAKEATDLIFSQCKRLIQVIWALFDRGVERSPRLARPAAACPAPDHGVTTSPVPAAPRRGPFWLRLTSFNGVVLPPRGEYSDYTFLLIARPGNLFFGV